MRVLGLLSSLLSVLFLVIAWFTLMRYDFAYLRIAGTLLLPFMLDYVRRLLLIVKVYGFSSTKEKRQ